ncbi:MAG TPA: NnrU family protein [Rhodocyclaceae bacterium]
MTVLVLGLATFLGAHGVRIYGDSWRSAQLERLGRERWRALYGAVSLTGLALIVWGFGLARAVSVPLWAAPNALRWATVLLMLPAFVLMVAGYLPDTRIKAALGHPMVAGVGVWAIAHLPANGRLEDLLLFGSFLAWAVFDYRASVRRDAAAGVVYPPGSAARDALAFAVGLAAWLAFAFLLHGPLIGRAALPT